MTIYFLQTMVSLLTIRVWDLEHPVMIKPFFNQEIDECAYIISVEVRRDNDDDVFTFTFE